MKLRAFLSSSVLLPVLVGVVAGCGGGGGGNGSTGTPVVVDGQSAVISAAQGAVLYSGGTAAGSAYPQDKTTLPFAGRTIAISSLIGQIAGGGYQARPATGSGWNPINGTNLFFEVSFKSLTTVDILLSTDGKTNNAGSIDLTLVRGGPNNYPIIVRATLNIILADETVTGTETLTEYDKSGSNFNVKGNLTSTANSVTIAFDLTDTAGTVTGTMSITKGAALLAYTNISATSAGLSAGFTVGTVTGSLTVNPDGSGSAQAQDDSGPWSLTWDAQGNFTLLEPSQQALSGNLATVKG